MKHILKKIITKILELEARAILWKYKPKIITVTGNVGKTSTKDAIYTLLSKTFFIRKSEKSFNSDIGVPLTILGCPNAWTNILLWFKNILYGLELLIIRHNFPKWLALEIGADRPNDIKNIAKWIKSDIVVVTRFSAVPVHIEFFKSREDLIKEKEYLVKSLKKDGVLVLNYDDDDVMNFKKSFKGRVITFGFNNGADIIGSNSIILYENKKPIGMNFKINISGNSVPISIFGTLGLQHLYPILSAVAVGVSQNINMVDISQSFAGHISPKGRMTLVEGKNDSIIIDDTYNSSPIALHQALEVCKEINISGRKIICVGDMMELGKFAIEEHKKAGEEIAVVADILLTVGVRSQYIKEGAMKAGMDAKNIFSFDDSRSAGDYLVNIISKDDLILVKGSQSMRMERTVEKIMAHPEQKADLLVRQEEEWTRR
ncbi:MAG: Mur ligase family protein [Patescibacteria group bacterium]|nr:Mur ligase family protein [Patescibacteria group bacterium]